MFCFCFFKTDCSHAVETISVLVMTTVRRQGGIIQIHNNRITRLTENVSKTKNCIKQVKKCKKKKGLTVARKTKKCSNFAQKSRKCSINAGKCKKCRKSAQRYRDMPNNRRFQFPLCITVVPSEIEDNCYAK